VARLELGQVAAQLTALELLDDVAHREGARRARAMLAEADPVRRPVDGEHLADDVLPRDRSPLARVARLHPVVAHEEVLALGDLPGARLAVAAVGLDVRL